MPLSPSAVPAVREVPKNPVRNNILAFPGSRRKQKPLPLPGEISIASEEARRRVPRPPPLAYSPCWTLGAPWDHCAFLRLDDNIIRSMELGYEACGLGMYQMQACNPKRIAKLCSFLKKWRRTLLSVLEVEDLLRACPEAFQPHQAILIPFQGATSGGKTNLRLYHVSPEARNFLPNGEGGGIRRVHAGARLVVLSCASRIFQ